jgi:hypothetical protein
MTPMHPSPADVSECLAMVIGSPDHVAWAPDVFDLAEHIRLIWRGKTVARRVGDLLAPAAPSA